MKRLHDCSDKKYRILELLKALPYQEYKVAKQKLPIALNISKRTFERWLYICKGDSTEISADKLAMIAAFFDLESINQIINYRITKHDTSSLQQLSDNNLIESLNLSK